MSPPITSFDSLAMAVEAVPYAKLLGIQSREEQGQPLFFLPFQTHNIGNTILPALHGGVIGGFLETAAILHVMWASEAHSVPKIVDFSIDFLRTGRPTELYGQCEIVRQGKRVANVLMTAWQEDRSKPVAVARAHFLLA